MYSGKKQSHITVQGQRIAEVGVNQGLEEHDFVLALQTPLQKELLQKCGHKRIVCVDATHGTNSYDFLLLMVLVVDELGEGFPIAWCYSNKEDSTAITIFFQHLRDRVGNIEPEWFMSDDASQYCSGWCTVFGGSPKKLLCSWHLDRAWRNAVSRHINNKQLQIEVYHTLRLLFEEGNCEQFQVSSGNKIQSLNIVISILSMNIPEDVLNGLYHTGKKQVLTQICI